MLENIPKISVLIITYNQEDVIERTLGSLLSQKEYIYEICICDDCSKDKTWNTIQEYSSMYPSLFKLHRNDSNIGIFENEEYTWGMPTGDVIYQVAGDDSCGEGYFKRVVNFIKDNSIDYKNEFFCIYGDYKDVYPRGDSFIFKNNMIISSLDPLRLTLRGLISNRSTCFSINILKKYIKVSQGRSHIAENAQDRQLQIFTEKSYYIPYIGNIYFTGIGVSSRLSKEVLKEREQIMPYLMSFLDKIGVKLKKKDIIYFKYIQSTYHKNWIKTYGLYIASIDLRMGLRVLKLRRTLFAILRRIPHKKTNPYVITISR